MRDTEREAETHRQKEKQAPRRKPDVGLDPWTPGSHPGPKGGAKPLSHPWIPPVEFFFACIWSFEPHMGWGKRTGEESKL